MTELEGNRMHSGECAAKKHWKCEQVGCDCRCHETVICSLGSAAVTIKRVMRRTRKRSPRGNWLVVSYRDGEIHWCTWVQTWAGVQASRRNSERTLREYEKTFGMKWRVIVIDIERVIDLGATEGANEIADLKRLYEL